MTHQIAVRLPDDLVKFIDDAVSNGSAPSRAALVVRALERERRRAVAENDARILARRSASEADDLDALAAYAHGLPNPDLD